MYGQQEIQFLGAGFIFRAGPAPKKMNSDSINIRTACDRWTHVPKFNPIMKIARGWLTSNNLLDNKISELLS